MSQVKLLSKHSKKIEREIVTFYKTVGGMVSLNSRATEIFAYLKIYDTLTQEQLKQLTGFSLGTISTTLQSFLQIDIISRQIIPGTHKYLYRIKHERVNFVYTSNTQIIENLEKLDVYIMEKQRELEEFRSKYPVEIEFLHRRLNSLRNYFEVQRRQINKEKKHSFFQEEVSGLIPKNEMIVYPFDTQEVEENIMNILGYYKEDPVKNRILSVFFTRRTIDQQTLMDISGFSRSTVSRMLKRFLSRKYIQALPREYRKPRIYYMKSISLSILSSILTTDDFIYSSIPRFREILALLQSEKQVDRDRNDVAFLVARIRELIKQIEDFKNGTRFIREAYLDLSKFVEKDTVHMDHSQ